MDNDLSIFFLVYILCGSLNKIKTLLKKKKKKKKKNKYRNKAALLYKNSVC